MDAHRPRRQKKILPPRHEPRPTPIRAWERLAGLVPLDLGEVAVSLSPSGAICAASLNGVYAARMRFLTAYRRFFSECETGKGGRNLLCAAPCGPFRQKIPDPFSRPGFIVSLGYCGVRANEQTKS